MQKSKNRNEPRRKKLLSPYQGTNLIKTLSTNCNWTEKYELIYAPHLPQRAIAAFPDYDSFVSIIFLHVLQFSRGNAIDSELNRSIHNMYDNIERVYMKNLSSISNNICIYHPISALLQMSINSQVLFPNWMILYRVFFSFSGLMGVLGSSQVGGDWRRHV